MSKKRGPQPSPRVHIDRVRFDEALKYKGHTVTSLAEELHVSKDALYKQRDNADGMHVKLLDQIAEILDINFGFFTGRYNYLIEMCRPKYKDSIMRIMLEKGRFPYNDESKSEIARAEIDYRQYYQAVIPAHGVPFEQFQAMPFKERLQFQEQLESAISQVFYNWFGGGDPERYDYLSVVDFDTIEEIYDWTGLDYITDPDFLKKVHKYWEMLDEMEMEMDQPVPDDNEIVEQVIYDCATGERTTRMVRYGDIDKYLERKYGIESDEDK